MRGITQNKSFKAWAFNVYTIPIIFISSLILFATVYTISRGIGGQAVITGSVLWGLMLSPALIQFLFCRIIVDEDGVTIHSASLTGNIRYGWDELDRAKWVWNGRAISFNLRDPITKADNYFVVPFRYKELAEIIREKKAPQEAPRAKGEVSKRTDYAILLVPILAWALLETTLRRLGFPLNPFIDAAIWGVTGFFSASYFMYRIWGRFRIGKLGRQGSALASGLMMGTLLLLFALISLLASSPV